MDQLVPTHIRYIKVIWNPSAWGGDLCQLNGDTQFKEGIRNGVEDSRDDPRYTLQ